MREAAHTPARRHTQHRARDVLPPVYHAGGGKKPLRVGFKDFLAEEFTSLERELEARAAAFTGASSLSWHDGPWLRLRDDKTKWHKVDPGNARDKRVYRAHRYTDDKGRPRRSLKTQPYPSGETSTFNDYEIIQEEFYRWRDARKLEAGRLTSTELKRNEIEREAKRQRHEEEREERAHKEAAAKEAEQRRAQLEAQKKKANFERELARWKTLPLALEHPYLAAKGLQGHAWPDVRQNGDELLIAGRNIRTGQVTALQRITAKGEKFYVSGSTKVGAAIFVTGEIPDDAQHIAMSEGWASGASGAEALRPDTPRTYVLAALDAGNLVTVHKIIQERWPGAVVLLLSDNDAGTASERDQNGKGKKNAGQVVAAKLRKLGCTVEIPRIPGRPKENVDFNDVYRELGLERVRRQLLAALNPNPYVRRGLALADEYDCTVTLRHGRDIDLGELREGITAIKGGMGIGKTNAVEAAIRKLQPASMMVGTHLIALTGNLSDRFGIKDYNDINPGSEHLFTHAAYTINSFCRLERNGHVKRVEVLFIDEIEQLLRRLRSREKFANKDRCYRVLNYLVQTARYVIVADAHLDTVTMNWLRRLRPQDKPHLVLGTLPPGFDRTVYRYDRQGDVRAVARDALLEGKRVYYASNVLERTHEVQAWLLSLKQELPGLRALHICSTTADDEEVKAWFRDPTGQSKKYDIVVASPSVSTGVSIDAGTFDVVCGDFTHLVDTPFAAMQALARARGVTAWHVCVSDIYVSKVTDRATLERAIWTNPGTDEDMKGDIDPETGTVRAVLGYQDLWLDGEVYDRKVTNRYADTFWQLVADDGFTVTRGAAAPDADDIEKQATEAVGELRTDALLAADRLTPEEAKEARKKRSSKNRDALELYDLMTAYRAPHDVTDDELRALIAHDNRGKRRGKLERLEVVRLSPDALAKRVDAEFIKRGGKGWEADMTRFDLWHRAYRAALEAAHCDPNTLKSTGKRYTAEDLTKNWIKPLEAEWSDLHEKVPGYPKLTTAWADPVKALGQVLGNGLGIGHKRQGHHGSASKKPVESDGKAAEDKKPIKYALKDETLAVQLTWLDRRAYIPEGDTQSMYLRPFKVPDTRTKTNPGGKRRAKSGETPQKKWDSKNLYISTFAVPSVPAAIEAFMTSRPEELTAADGAAVALTAADRRAVALTAYAAAKPEVEQSATFAHLEHTLLGRRPVEGATDAELDVDAAALRLATLDPRASLWWCLKAARNVLGGKESDTSARRVLGLSELVTA